MGRGSSKAGGGGGGGATPSGVTYEQFMQMSDDQKYQVMDSILDNKSIKVPDYLDDSDTSKILYGLGMNQKPTVVDDATLDSLQGREIFRTVYEGPGMPPPSTEDVLDQIRNGDYTQMSRKGGSAHGRALYFATNFYDSAMYGHGKQNSIISRSKINPNANIRSENSLTSQMLGDTAFQGSRLNRSMNSRDHLAAYAIAHGVDGWYSGSYTMMVNRGALTMSSRNKTLYKSAQSKSINYADAQSWQEAMDV